jgi:hypothetical protein
MGCVQEAMRRIPVLPALTLRTAASAPSMTQHDPMFVFPRLPYYPPMAALGH